jgi:hypothetical protein
MRRAVSRKGAKEKKNRRRKAVAQAVFFAPLVFLFFAPLRETAFLSCG